MRILFIFLIILLSSCNSVTSKNNSINDFNFSKEMSLEEFKLKLKSYAEKNPYPDIND